MDLIGTLQELQKTSIPNLLVIAGIVFLLLSLVGELGAIVRLPQDRQKPVGIVGIVLLVLGIGLYLIPSPAPSADSPEELASKLLREAQNWEPIANTEFATDTWPKDFNEEGWAGNATITGSGTYLVTLNYIGEGSDATYWIIPILEPASDFYLSVEGKFIEGEDENGYGLLFRLNGIGDPGYLFRLFERVNEYDIQYVDNGLVELKHLTLSPAISKGRFNKITVIARGTEFYFYINDTFVEHISDNQRTRGSVGLRMAVDKGTEHVFEFDNFILRVPN
jgi:hypothetical protein